MLFQYFFMYDYLILLCQIPCDQIIGYFTIRLYPAFFRKGFEIRIIDVIRNFLKRGIVGIINRSGITSIKKQQTAALCFQILFLQLKTLLWLYGI